MQSSHTLGQTFGDTTPTIARLRGTSIRMRRLRHMIWRIGASDGAVLINGESGSGKELVAEAIHQSSARRMAPFIAVNCAAIPSSLIEAELFGFNKGSFTGAIRSHAGIFERASGGTVLLDEIAEMPLDMQACLLRVLETKSFTRIGGCEVIAADVRIIAATNRCPQQAMRDGRLRPDVFYRLNVFPIDVPPLRDRGATDIDILIEHFLERLNEQYGMRKSVSDELRIQFRMYDWPGNVRELRNVMERAYVLAEDELLPVPIAPTLAVPPVRIEATQWRDDSISVPLGTNLQNVERLVIESTLKHCSGNRQRAADLLGCSIKTLYNKLQSYREAIATADVGFELEAEH